MYSAYVEGRCDVATSDKSQLAAARAGFTTPADHVILPITISKEPLTPAVPSGDDQWFDIVKTVIWGLINAEEYGITSDNVDQMKSSENSDIRALLGAEGEADWGYTTLGLSPDALAKAISAVGNYGEIYDRYFGANGLAFQLDRGLNNLMDQWWFDVRATDQVIAISTSLWVCSPSLQRLHTQCCNHNNN